MTKTAHVRLSIVVEYLAGALYSDVVKCLIDGIVHKHGEWILPNEDRLDVVSAYKSQRKRK